MFESAQNQSHPTRLSKTYFHSKFQLIWSSNGQENPKNPLFWGCQSQKWSGPPKKWSFWIFSAIWRPNELKFGVKIGFWYAGWVTLIFGTFNHFWLSYSIFFWKWQNLPVFFKWARSHLKTDCTPPCWVSTQPQWRGDCVDTHTPGVGIKEIWEKLICLKKNSFFQKMSFFQKNKFFSFFCLVNP